MISWLHYKFKNLIYRCLSRRIPRLRWDPEENIDAGYRSQFGQDQFVAERLQFKRNGVFVDIGANDGITLSNSYFFEKKLDWTGVAVEPLPEIFQQLSQNRNCKLAKICISNTSGIVNFLHCEAYNGMLSGIVSKFHFKHGHSIERANNATSGTNEIIQVDSMTPMQLLKEHTIDRIDYLSIDTEGGELDILQSFDLNAISVHFVTIENNHYDLKIRRYMRRRGFCLVAIAGVDEIYENTAVSRRVDLEQAA